MAIMKTKIEDCASEGERIIYNAFKNNLSVEFIVYSNLYIMDVAGDRRVANEIDFIIYHDDVGLLVMEAKDWRIDVIGRVDGQQITLTNGVSNKNPFSIALNKQYAIKNKLLKRAEFESRVIPNKLCMPINSCVCLPFITRFEWEKKLAELQINNPIDIKLCHQTVIFKDEFEKGGVFGEEKHAESLNRLRNLRSYKFAFEFDDAQKKCLDMTLGIPYTEDTLVKDIVSHPIITVDDNIIALDDRQKEIANNYLKQMYKKPGHLYIRGVAGSGKTIILQHMFSEIATDQSMKLLYVGRQTELVHNFRAALESGSYSPEPGAMGLSVCNTYDVKSYAETKSADLIPNYLVSTFDGIFKFVFGKEVYETLCGDKEDDKGKKGKYPESKEISKYIKENLDSIPELFDFVFVDEGHNLPNEWIKFLVKTTKGQESGNLTYVEDPEQAIYLEERDPEKSGLEFKYREDLLLNYRNTFNISYFALSLSQKQALVLKEKNRLSLFKKSSNPTITFKENISDLADIIVDKCISWERQGFNLFDIALIYPMQNDEFTKKLSDTFEKKDMYLSSQYSPYRVKKMFPSHADKIIARRSKNYKDKKNRSIQLITSWSVQGASYKCTIVLLDQFKPAWSERVKNNLMYISLTRAMDELAVMFTSATKLYYERAEKILKGMEEVALVKNKNHQDRF